ncbi:MAG: transcription elongation factor GreA [Clostridia bacterium]
MAEVFLTAEGKKEKEARLEELKAVLRPQVIEKVKIARSYGDLSENAEYDSARDEQGRIEAEIKLIEDTLKLAKIVDTGVKSNVVTVGAKVKLFDLEFNEEVVYTIVGAIECNPDKNMVSNNSPIGKALIGKKKGEIVSYMAPGGIVSMKILEIK